MDNDEHDSSRIHFIGRTIGIAIVIGAVAASVYAFRLNFVRPRTDDAAIRALYARFARPVYTMGLRLLGSREAAEELTQDVFVTAW